MKNNHMPRAYSKARRMGHHLLACIPHPNPGDAHLSKCLVQTDTEYVVWTYNIQDDAFHAGHYHRDLRDGLTTLTEKVAELIG